MEDAAKKCKGGGQASPSENECQMECQKKQILHTFPFKEIDVTERDIRTIRKWRTNNPDRQQGRGKS